MATNLISVISQALSAAITTRIASVLGLSELQVRKAVDAAVPALLGALISLVSKPSGAAKLHDFLATQEPGVLSNLANVIGESGQKTFVDKGTSALNSLLGKDTALALGGALSQYSGIGVSNSKSLLGLLTPAVLGMLGQEQREQGLDAPGLARLLTSQKDTVVAALPPGFSKYFGAIGVLDDVTTATGTCVPRRGVSRVSHPRTTIRVALASRGRCGFCDRRLGFTLLVRAARPSCRDNADKGRGTLFWFSR